VTKSFKSPDTTLLIFSMVIVAAIMTWIVPSGSFDKDTIEVEGVGTREVVVSGSFRYLDEQHPQGIGAILTAPVYGFLDAADIIVFVLIVGGAFSVFAATGAVDAVMKRVVIGAGQSKAFEFLVIPLLMVLFSLAGATFGMAEEVIPMILIFVPLSIALGYDSIVGVAIPMVGSGAGFAGAPLNPFTVGIAQGIAEVPIFSGLAFRWGVWALTTAAAIAFVMVYAHRIKKDPTRSSVHGLDQRREDTATDESPTSPTTRHQLALGAFLIGIITLVVGVLRWGWYINEIAGLFLAIGIVVGLLGGLKAADISQGFVTGARDLLATAIIIGLARGILVVMRDGQIIDTVLNALATSIEGAGPILTAQLMFFVQSAINFFIPSGSGQAALTMPVMAPLADLVGVTRQTAVLAYQMGDGFTNLIIPTNPVLMGALAVANVPWQKWARWVLSLQVIFFAMGLAVLVVAVSIGWGA
jgi:uncharacterized ion transporter superfamily protein YfcC